MTYGEILEKENPKPIKETISKDEKEIMELYKESDKQRLLNESPQREEYDLSCFGNAEFNMSGLSGAIQVC